MQYRLDVQKYFIYFSKSFNSNLREWIHEENGKIVLPYSFHSTMMQEGDIEAGQPNYKRVIEVMDRMETDLGCFDFIFIHPDDLVKVKPHLFCIMIFNFLKCSA